MTAPAFTPYGFTADDPPTVSDFETALGVVDYVRQVRDVVDPPATKYVQTRDTLAEAATQVLNLAPFLAAPDPDEDDEEEEPVDAPTPDAEDTPTPEEETA